MANDRDHPWLRPLWRRVAIVAVCAAWSALEFYSGQPFWGVLAGGMGVYGAWMYLLNYPKPEAEKLESNKKEE
ncbi:DUF3329 domain-containing protein [Mesorhizobium sp. LHD-90]|uniref:DUF3329 domain-containing protein n=1 Tax=Mesorhizobium sp. LHD-90 TaxID=3071414 RepID=UPI0027E1982E|nr:DUF3329 domain-containing protein [Mesorhizobium sp. LHD-90]MDQ6434347.1 DUF3329 domain-containing protein [Mesorhizobium sp. LHD-90]